jgi:tRNA(His) guanylyltransferase
MKDDLGERMKTSYEKRVRQMLPRRTYTILRIDGKAFHSYTRGCQRPYDLGLMADMDATCKSLCEQIEGARIGYVQSDEISILLTDFESPQTQAWFDGSVNKLVSTSASIATAAFNKARIERALKFGGPNWADAKWAQFDSRAFSIAERIEVYNLLLWRQQDASRNSVSMAAQANFSHTALQGKSSNEMQEMLFQEKGINWSTDFPVGFKRGRCVVREATTKDLEYTDKRTGETRKIEGVTRHEWNAVEPPIFSADRREWLLSHVPDQG